MAVSVMEMFTLSAAEPIRDIVSDLKTMSDTIFDASENYVTQHQAGEEVVITKTDRASCSPFRFNSHRAASPLGLSAGMVNAFAQPPFLTGARIPRVLLNNAIPLRLRI